MPSANCPGHDALQAYALGRLSEEASETICAHFAACPQCKAGLAACDDAEDTLVAQLRRPALADPFLDEPQCQLALAQARALVSRASSQPGPSDDSWRGKAIGEYQLLEELGHGGMGTVYKALHTKLDRVVAIKVLRLGRAHDPQAIARFEREMRAIGKLDHQHIVRAHDAREIDGTLVLVMEYLDGLDLGKLVRRAGPLGTADACELIRQAAVGLQCVHEHGLVHRDIKPSNLMLTPLSHRGRGAESEGAEVKILDLGLARLHAEQPPPAEDATGAARGTVPIFAGTVRSMVAKMGLSPLPVEGIGPDMTGSDQVMGTLDYMAPEQVANSREVDIRADIYSLGCTLYTLLTGSPPLRNAGEYTPAAMPAAPLQQEPALGRVRPEVPAALKDILARMLAQDPAQRYAQPAEVAQALEPLAAAAKLADLLARGEGGLAGEPPRPACRAKTGTAPRARRRLPAAWPWVAVTILSGMLVLGVSAVVVVKIVRNGQETVLRVPDGASVEIGPQDQVKVVMPGPAEAELNALVCRVQQSVEAKDYLRAHVGFWRIKQRWGATPAYAQLEKELQRLAQDIAAHMDLDAVEYHDDYVLYRAPATAKPWPELVRSFEGWFRVTPSALLLRVFLEDPSQPDAIQVKGEVGCNMLDATSGVGCAYVQISDSGLAAVQRIVGQRCTLRIGTLRHASPAIEVSIPLRTTTVLGDIVLLRPEDSAMGRLELLLDSRQAETTEGSGPPSGCFHLGRITAGGRYGLQLALADRANHDAGLLAAGKLWLVWDRNLRQRWLIDVPAGQTTRVRFSLESPGTLADPQILRTPMTGPATGDAGRRTTPQ